MRSMGRVSQFIPSIAVLLGCRSLSVRDARTTILTRFPGGARRTNLVFERSCTVKYISASARWYRWLVSETSVYGE